MASCQMFHSSYVSVLAQTDFVSPVQKLMAEVGECPQDHSLGCSGSAGGSPILVGPQPSGRWSFPGLSVAQPRLRSSPGQKTLCRHMDSGGVSLSRQPSRDNDCSQSASVLLRKPSAQDSPGSNGQHHCSFLSELDKRDQVTLSQPFSPEDHSIVPGEVHYASICSLSRNRNIEADRLSHYLSTSQGNLDRSVEWSLE